MTWPWVSRALFEEVRSQRDDLARQLRRWQDIVGQQNWGQQFNDSIPLAQAAAQPAAEDVPPQETEEELQQTQEETIRQREAAELTVRTRTRKSSVPAYMERVMFRRIAQRARAAFGTATVPAQAIHPEVAARFATIKAETLKNIKTVH